MSKRRRRNSRRSKTSCSSKQSYSQLNSQRLNRNLWDSSLCEDDPDERAETDSFQKELFFDSVVEGEQEIELPSKDKRFRRDSREFMFHSKEKGPSASRCKVMDNTVTITTSVTIHDSEGSSSRVVSEKSHENVTSPMLFTKTKVKCNRSKIKIEIQEVFHPEESDIITSVMVKNNREKRKESMFKNKWNKNIIFSNDQYTNSYPSGKQFTRSTPNNTAESYTFGGTERKMNVKKESPNHSKYQEETECCKSCSEYESYNTSPTSQDNTFDVHQDDDCSQETEQTSFSTLDRETFSAIPPPYDFADKGEHFVNTLTQAFTSCQINLHDKHEEVQEPLSQCDSKDTSGNTNKKREHFSNIAFCQQSSESDTYDPLLEEFQKCSNRAMFTKDFIYNHDGKTWLRNNSIAVVECKPRTSLYLHEKPVRRRTFPVINDSLTQFQESLPSFRESYSSGTLSPFFMQSLTFQAENAARLCMENEVPFTFCAERRSSSGNIASCKPIYGIQHVCQDQMTGENLFVPEEVFQCSSLLDETDPDSCIEEGVEHTEVAESGFDEEIVETDDQNHDMDLFIHIIPPSRSGSQEHVNESGKNVQMFFHREHEDCDDLPKSRKGSVLTITVGEREQRYVQCDNKSHEVTENDQQEVLNASCEGPSVAAILGTDVPSTSTQTRVQIHEDLAEELTKNEEDTDNGSFKRKESDGRAVTQDLQEDPNKDSNRNIQMTQSIVRQTSPTDVKGMKERLRPPDVSLKDMEDAPDHWANRRKLFKESKQWSSAGGSSITSNITEESVNSDDTPSTDLTTCDIEEKGFYTETFHSASWIHRGDDVHPSNSPRGLSNRPRPVTSKSRALPIMKLEGAEVGPDCSLGKSFVFKCCPTSGNRVYYFCATSSQEMKRWLEAMEKAVHPITQHHVWIDVTRHNANLPPLAIKNPECLGLLHQLDRRKDLWLQNYCILKDGCLYFYAGIRSTHALGGIFLHGYTVKEQLNASKRSTIELKPPSEEFKTFYLSAENAAENKRWILALRASISKWLHLHEAIQYFMNRPPEETRM